MKIINAYVSSAVLSATLLVMLVVLSLDLVFALVAELDDLKNDYQAMDALVYILFTIPRRIYDYLPLGAFMGALIGLGALAKNSELTVIRAAGVSVMGVSISAIRPVLFVVLIAAFLGEYVAPTTEKIAQSEKALKRGAQSNIVYGQGLWHKEGESFIHINAVEPNGALHGVSINEYDDTKRLVKSTFAAKALYHQGRWSLLTVEESLFSENSVSTTKHDIAQWDTELTPSLLNILIVKPDNLSISGLYDYSTYLSEQGLDGGIYSLSFWKKLLQPLTTLSLVLVAISFVFGPLRSVAMGTRVFVGLLVGLSFKYAQDLLGPASMVFGFEPMIATLLPIGACALIGLTLLRRS